MMVGAMAGCAGLVVMVMVKAVGKMSAMNGLLGALEVDFGSRFGKAVKGRVRVGWLGFVYWWVYSLE